ncbi:MAG: hypothetical protein CR955_01200 [Thiotrichales bacterium]|nr:MAG: hypothetical protein CR955_01200 [Thiotrichales bacterium]
MPFNGKTIRGNKMNNQTSLTFSVLQGKKAYCGRTPLSKQTGSVFSKLLLILVMGGIGYGIYTANNKGLINTKKFTSLKSTISNTFSSEDNFKGYGVQLMATKQLEQAKTVMNDFARDGYSAFILANKSKGRTIYKVRLGPYSHKPEAVAVKDKVVRRYPQNPFVKTSLVIYKPN